MSDFDNKGFREQGRPQTSDLLNLDQGVFPNEAFETSLVDGNESPILTLKDPWKLYANIIGMFLGTCITSLLDKDYSEYGYLKEDFNNKVSTTGDYAAWYAEIGDMFETQHTDVGDSASGAGYFYPTPVPGYYSRSALSLNVAVVSASSASDFITLLTADYTRLSSLRDSGLPIKLTLVSGTLTGGLTAETEYFVGFLGSDQIAFYTTEENAITDTTRVTLTDTNIGTFTFHQKGIYFNDTFQDFDVELSNGTGGFVSMYTTTPNKLIGWSKTLSSGTVQTNNVKLSSLGGVGNKLANETRPKTLMLYKYWKVV